nr:NF-kappa-B inhibitor delta-like [Desmodus rotundus]
MARAWEIKSNKTVLHLAVQAANPTLVQLLLELPQGDLRAFVNMKAHGNTALHMAAALPPGPSQEAIVWSLLAAGADPTLQNLENEQPVLLLRPGPGPEGALILKAVQTCTSSVCGIRVQPQSKDGLLTNTFEAEFSQRLSWGLSEPDGRAGMGGGLTLAPGELWFLQVPLLVVTFTGA